MRVILILIILFAVNFGFTEKSYGWGKFGHLTICDLAYRNLTDTSKDKLKEILHDEDGGLYVEGRGKMRDRYYTSLNMGCLEEDEIPRRNPQDHFVNLPRDQFELEGSSCPLKGSCIMAGIERDLDILADETQDDEDRVFALMAVGHWIGDIHQPLHVSFKDDKGGNSIGAKVDGKCGKYSFKGKNLHSIWDNCLLDAGLFEKVRQSPSYKRSWSRFTITYRAVDAIQKGRSLKQEIKMVEGEPWEWANESLAITLDPETRYCTMKDGVCKYSEERRKYSKARKRNELIGQDYIEAHKWTAERRVILAGYRLAHLINQALDTSYTQPIKNSTQIP